MIHLYTGDGKGKTTAACGLCVRMAGAGRTAALIQFLKSGDSSELRALSLLPGVRTFALEKPHGFFYNLTESEREELRAETRAELALAGRLLREGCGLLVLDEAVDALNLGLIELPALLGLLARAGETELVLTGRNPPRELAEAADYHTEFRAVRHPYDRGVGARRGIEY